MKNIKPLYFFFALIFAALSAYADTTEHEKDIVEQTFPQLKRVTSESDINDNTKYALIAHSDAGIMYAVKDGKLSGTEFTTTKLTSTTNLSEKSIFFTLKKSDSKYRLKGKNSEYYIDASEVLTSGTATKYWDILTSIEYYDGLILGANGGYYLATKNTTKAMTMYPLQNYAHEGYTSYDNNFPALIYAYDTSAQPIDTIQIKTAEGYGTIYSDVAFVMPSGVTGYTITAADGASYELTLEEKYPAGSTVPALTALLVKGSTGSYPVYAPTEDEAAANAQQLADASEDEAAENLLRGTLKDATTTGPDETKSYYFYKLYYLTDTENNQQLGFFWGADGGAAFTNQARRAYLSLEQTQAAQVRGFILPNQDAPTAIATPLSPNSSALNGNSRGIYTLSGTKLGTKSSALPAGIYIINGQKVLLKK